MAASGGAHVRFAHKKLGSRGEREARRFHERWLERERAVAVEHERRSAESPRFKELRRRGAERSVAAIDADDNEFGVAAHELAKPLFAEGAHSIAGPFFMSFVCFISFVCSHNISFLLFAEGAHSIAAEEEAEAAEEEGDEQLEEEEEEEQEEDDGGEETEEDDAEEENDSDSDDDPPPPAVEGGAPVEGIEGAETDDYRTDFESSGDIDIG
jgi:hypothetical protein